MSKTFHNLTARDNAYFLAREKMKEVDAQIWKSNVDDYNKILNVYPDLTKNIVSGIKQGTDDVIKKASLIPEKHKNSAWLDDSYIIIGKAYLYKDDLKSSMSFFKFVNSKSEDPAARHAALILLMRAYIDSADYYSTKVVIDFFNKKLEEGEVLTEDNKRDYFLTKAFYHQKMEEYDKMIPLLENSVDLIPKKDIRARTHFIIGQLHQMFGNDTSAYTHYSAATKRNPPYELLFHSKLYLAQVSDTDSRRTGKRMDKYFQKLLTDKKNKEYRDKIYYEMGNYELRKHNNPKAISNFEKSIREESINPHQRALSYYKLAEIYYKSESFELSKYYYDSTVAIWDKKDKLYNSLSIRQKVLSEFVEYVKTVQREDSLQRLRNLPKEKLDAFIDQVIVLEQDKAKQKATIEKINKERKAIAAAQNNATAPEESNSTFPLTNPVAIASGKIDFIKIWGNRKLEDNWRRSKKENLNINEEQATIPKDTIDSTSIKKDTLEVKSEKTNKDLYYKDIPFTAAQLDTSNKRIEVALYNIGKIYNQKLEEPIRSIKTFNTLLNRFPQTNYKPEVYYFIYLIYKNLKNEKDSDVYKDKLLSEFPNSLYAKLIKNPNYLQDNKIANLKAHEKYKEAFELYKNGNYKAIDSMISTIRAEFPDNDIEDKLDLLSILAFGQTGSPIIYQKKLNTFIDQYKNSPLVAKAEELLSASENFIKGKNGGSISEAYVKYSTELEKPHLLVSVLPKSISVSKIIKEFKSFNVNNSEKQTLKVQSFAFSDTTNAIVVAGFEDKFSARVYINKLRDEKSFFRKYGYIDYPVFIITDHNYQLFKDSKNLKDYLIFFKENY